MATYSLRSVYATLPRTTRGKPIVLGGDPKGKNFLYANGNSIIIRDIVNPYTIADVYTEHSKDTTVAKYSPSGYYIASGDILGKVRIWDTVNKEHILKNEFQPLGGAIKDIAWSPDSTKIVVAGEGRDKFAHVFNMDTGTSVGEIPGHSKAVNSVDFRPTRPFRIVTASEDTDCAYFEGPPFKFKHTCKDHGNFVNVVRFSPDGDRFITGGADKRAIIYDGKNGEHVGELGSPAHSGGIYGLSFSPDGSQVLTVSGDKTAKLWDLGSGAVVSEFVMGTAKEDMQVGCLWQGQYMLTVSLSGFINYLDRNNPNTPLRVIKGHNKPITAMSVSEDKSMIFTGSSDAHINYWDPVTGQDDEIQGKCHHGHTNQIMDMTVVDGQVTTVSMDDTMRLTSAVSKEYGCESTKLDSMPKALATVSGGTSVVACMNHLMVLENGKKMSSMTVKYEPCSVAIHPGQTEVAVGGSLDNKIHLFELNRGTLNEKKTIDLLGAALSLKYSPDGAFLASGGADRRVRCFEFPSYDELWDDPSHSARVNSVAWSPDSSHFASGSLDNNLIVWKPVKGTNNKLIIKGAHPMSQITRVDWTNDNTLVSTGQDSCIKQWNIVHS